MIIEDDDSLRKFLASELVNYFKIIQASNGFEALNAIRNKTPDLILTDFNMPQMNGEDFIMAINQEGFDIPCLVMTGYLSRELEERLTELGVYKILSKPFDFEKLLYLLEKALE